MNYSQFEQLIGPQLYANGLPPPLWSVLHHKLTNDLLDVGSFVQLAMIEEDYETEGDQVPSAYAVVAITDIPKDSNVWIIDHTWTFRLRQARSSLNENPDLVPRLARMLGAEVNVDAVMAKMWTRVRSYLMATESQMDEESCWYINDEVGTCLQHDAETPNMNIAPFLFNGMSYSILWPIADISEGEVLSHNWSIGAACPEAALIVYGTEEERQAALDTCSTLSIQRKPCIWHTPTGKSSQEPPRPAGREVITVWTDVPLVEQYLKDPRFKLVEDVEAAELVWTASYTEEPVKAFPNANYISQFQGEILFCSKSGLAGTIESAPYLAVTYNMKTELPFFIGEFMRRQKEGKDNHWIVKPCFMARSMDMHIYRTIDPLLRVAETGPRVACKYIESPALFQGRKFDMRFVVLLRSVDPLEVYLYDTFYIRAALQPYSLDNIDVYEKHWTVMNYKHGVDMKKFIYPKDFIAEIERQHGEGSWAPCYQKIKEMLNSTFATLSDRLPQMHNNKFRAMYGIDVMITNELNPVILEITFSPDITRACLLESEFCNDVFRCLFLGEVSPHLAL
eukprot:PhF_6_TR43641/c0_g1_i1/m.67060/K16609/TTLL12; tubulin--tyrosine ligase-like protein 12